MIPACLCELMIGELRVSRRVDFKQSKVQQHVAYCVSSLSLLRLCVCKDACKGASSSGGGRCLMVKGVHCVGLGCCGGAGRVLACAQGAAHTKCAPAAQSGTRRSTCNTHARTHVMSLVSSCNTVV